MHVSGRLRRTGRQHNVNVRLLSRRRDVRRRITKRVPVMRGDLYGPNRKIMQHVRSTGIDRSDGVLLGICDRSSHDDRIHELLSVLPRERANHIPPANHRNREISYGPIAGKTRHQPRLVRRARTLGANHECGMLNGNLAVTKAHSVKDKTASVIRRHAIRAKRVPRATLNRIADQYALIQLHQSSWYWSTVTSDDHAANRTGVQSAPDRNWMPRQIECCSTYERNRSVPARQAEIGVRVQRCRGNEHDKMGVNLLNQGTAVARAVDDQRPTVGRQLEMRAHDPLRRIQIFQRLFIQPLRKEQENLLVRPTVRLLQRRIEASQQQTGRRRILNRDRHILDVVLDMISVTVDMQVDALAHRIDRKVRQAPSRRVDGRRHDPPRRPVRHHDDRRKRNAPSRDSVQLNLVALLRPCPIIVERNRNKTDLPLPTGGGAVNIKNRCAGKRAGEQTRVRRLPSSGTL